MVWKLLVNTLPTARRNCQDIAEVAIASFPNVRVPLFWCSTYTVLLYSVIVYRSTSYEKLDTAVMRYVRFVTGRGNSGDSCQRHNRLHALEGAKY